MSLITPASPFICTEVDVAFDADLTQPSESWDWTTLGDYQDGEHTRPRLLNQTIEIANGRRDESNLADPSTVEVLLGNGDLALTPRNPASPYWPGLKRGTPLRVMVQAGLPYLQLTGLAGSRATTPDNAALDITGDLAGAIELLSPMQHPPADQAYDLVGKTATNQRSWLVYLFAGTLRFRWSTNGTADAGTKVSTLGLPTPEAGPLSIGWYFDVDNGSGGNTLTWYVHRGTLAGLLADLPGSVFGDPIIDSGTTSIFSGTASLDIGDASSTGFNPLPGRVDRLQVRSGDLSTGTVVANLDCTTLAAGATGTTDSAGRVWSFNAATISDRRPRFTGRVDKVTADWTQVDESNPLMPTVAHVKVSASGVLERLAQGDAIGSALFRAVTAPVNQTAVIVYWPHEDASESTQLASAVSGAPAMSVRGDFSLAADDTLASSQPLVTVAAGDNAFFSGDIPRIADVAGVNWQVTRFFKIDEPAVSPAVTSFGATRTSGRVAKWTVTINDTQVSVVGVDDDGAGVVLGTMAIDSRMFNTWAMVILDVTDNGANVDWAVHVVPVPLGFDFFMSGSFAGATGVPSSWRNSLTGPPSGISVGHVIVTTGLPVGWLAPADTAYVGEPAPQRVFRLCREQGIPVAVDGPYEFDWDAATAAGALPMGPQRPGKLLDLLDECAVVDHGVLGEQRGALGLTYRSGVSMRNQPVRLSLARARRQAIDPFEEVDDDQRFANDVTAARPDGSSYRIEDPAIAAGTEERYEQTTEANVETDLWLPDQAGWRYHLGTWEEPRFPQVWTDVAKTADLVEDALGFGLGDRFELADPPPGCPPVDQLADGIVEELERFQWRIGVNGHPARPWDTAIYDDEDLGRYDTAGSVLENTFVAGTSTSMDVETTLGQLWTTDADDLPLDVVVGGVVVTVTAIGAPSGQVQTFTVSTDVSVAKSIPAGSDVRLAQPSIMAP